MGASATLLGTALSVSPGAQTVVELRVRNTGSVVDEFTFEPLGPASSWMEVVPASVSLFPSAEQTVTVRFAPPRLASVKPGVTPFAVRVASREDPSGSVVEEGTVAVGSFEDRSVELYPTNATGSRNGRYQLAVDNRGNEPVDVSLDGADPENACRYRFSQPALSVAAGAAAFSKLTVSPAKTYWRGPPKAHQFQIIVAAEGHQPEMVNGTLLQQPKLPPWFVKAAIAAVALLLVFFILWQTLFKSSIQSAARDAVAAPLSSLSARVDQVAPPAGGGGGGGGGGGTTTTVAGGSGSGGSSTTSPTGTGTTNPGVPGSTITPYGNPSDFQLGGSVPAPNTTNFTKTFNADFAVTDIVLQNPDGDTGRVVIKRGNVVLFTQALENFRDLDLHFVAPYMFGSGNTRSLTMSVTCSAVTAPATTCNISGSFSGFSK